MAVQASNNRRSIREVQQTFAESLGYANEIIWDLLSVNQAHILKLKIKNLIQDPVVPAGLTEEERAKAEAKVQKQKAANEDLRETFFNAIWSQRKYCNRQSLTSIFYVMVATDETDHTKAAIATEWSCHPVVRVRRCVSISEDSTNSSDCCMVFVDDQGRVYQNWMAYVENNELPKGIMVAPRRGVYNLINNVVQLETWLTPVSTTRRQVLNAMDTTTAVTGLAAASVPLLGLLAVPIAGPVMAAAGLAAMVCGGYGLGRSASQLVDRGTHEQSISITNRTARNHWLGVGGGTVALGAAGATTLLTAATNAGREVGAITQLTVNGMNISSIMISGTGLANGIVDLVLKYMDGDDISAMDALQLSASLVLFTHSVYNFKLASTIISETSNNRIGTYRQTLSNRQRYIHTYIILTEIVPSNLSIAFNAIT
ncbi:uncharacterized protein LOC115562330 [Drosophila navojoa]|uniref:uncharacterized protein LOC115562330 n=1 Tax=Drosophila navojoa TaxID=7232 RepID=UPI0011BF38BD|nr:uncharacterized protein LOC115562330 [Drosophila navojoa]